MKKDLLLITPRLPYPPTSGDRLKGYNFILILSKYYNINLISLSEDDMDAEAEAFCQKYTKEYKVFKKPKYLSYISTLKAFITGKPLQVHYYYFNDVKKYADEQIKKCDFSINTHSRTTEYVIDSGKLKFFDIVDSIAIIYKSSSKSSSKDNLSFFWRSIHNFERKRLYEYEKKCVQSYANTFFVNKEESEYWSKYGNTTHIPNGVNGKLFDYKEEDKKYNNYIAFLGKMDYVPNDAAMIWFIQNVFSKLNSDIKLIIIGIYPSTKLKSMVNDRIIVTGFVDDPYIILNSSLLTIAPMQNGGGIQNKVLESMALGKITITSTLGAKPITEAKDKEHLLIEDNPDEMAKLINDIYEKKVDYSDMGAKAKKLMQDKYTWAAYEEKLIKAISAEID